MKVFADKIYCKLFLVLLIILLIMPSYSWANDITAPGQDVSESVLGENLERGPNTEINDYISPDSHEKEAAGNTDLDSEESKEESMLPEEGSKGFPNSEELNETEKDTSNSPMKILESEPEFNVVEITGVNFSQAGSPAQIASAPAGSKIDISWQIPLRYQVSVHSYDYGFLREDDFLDQNYDLIFLGYDYPPAGKIPAELKMENVALMQGYSGTPLITGNYRSILMIYDETTEKTTILVSGNNLMVTETSEPFFSRGVFSSKSMIAEAVTDWIFSFQVTKDVNIPKDTKVTLECAYPEIKCEYIYSENKNLLADTDYEIVFPGQVNPEHGDFLYFNATMDGIAGNIEMMSGRFVKVENAYITTSGETLTFDQTSGQVEKFTLVITAEYKGWSGNQGDPLPSIPLIIKASDNLKFPDGTHELPVTANHKGRQSSTYPLYAQADISVEKAVFNGGSDHFSLQLTEPGGDTIGEAISIKVKAQNYSEQGTLLFSSSGEDLIPAYDFILPGISQTEEEPGIAWQGLGEDSLTAGSGFDYAQVEITATKLVEGKETAPLFLTGNDGHAICLDADDTLKVSIYNGENNTSKTYKSVDMATGPLDMSTLIFSNGNTGFDKAVITLNSGLNGRYGVDKVYFSYKQEDFAQIPIFKPNYLLDLVGLPSDGRISTLGSFPIVMRTHLPAGIKWENRYYYGRLTCHLSTEANGEGAIETISGQSLYPCYFRLSTINYYASDPYSFDSSFYSGRNSDGTFVCPFALGEILQQRLTAAGYRYQSSILEPGYNVGFDIHGHNLSSYDKYFAPFHNMNILWDGDTYLEYTMQMKSGGEGKQGLYLQGDLNILNGVPSLKPLSITAGDSLEITVMDAGQIIASFDSSGSTLSAELNEGQLNKDKIYDVRVRFKKAPGARIMGVSRPWLVCSSGISIFNIVQTKIEGLTPLKLKTGTPRAILDDGSAGAEISAQVGEIAYIPVILDSDELIANSLGMTVTWDTKALDFKPRTYNALNLMYASAPMAARLALSRDDFTGGLLRGNHQSNIYVAGSGISNAINITFRQSGTNLQKGTVLFYVPVQFKRPGETYLDIAFRDNQSVAEQYMSRYVYANQSLPISVNQADVPSKAWSGFYNADGSFSFYPYKNGNIGLQAGNLQVPCKTEFENGTALATTTALYKAGLYDVLVNGQACGQQVALAPPVPLMRSEKVLSPTMANARSNTSIWRIYNDGVQDGYALVYFAHPGRLAGSYEYDIETGLADLKERRPQLISPVEASYVIQDKGADNEQDAYAVVAVVKVKAGSSSDIAWKSSAKWVWGNQPRVVFSGESVSAMFTEEQWQSLGLSGELNSEQYRHLWDKYIETMNNARDIAPLYLYNYEENDAEEMVHVPIYSFPGVSSDSSWEQSSHDQRLKLYKDMLKITAPHTYNYLFSGQFGVNYGTNLIQPYIASMPSAPYVSLDQGLRKASLSSAGQVKALSISSDTVEDIANEVMDFKAALDTEADAPECKSDNLFDPQNAVKKYGIGKLAEYHPVTAFAFATLEKSHEYSKLAYTKIKNDQIESVTKALDGQMQMAGLQNADQKQKVNFIVDYLDMVWGAAGGGAGGLIKTRDILGGYMNIYEGRPLDDQTGFNYNSSPEAKQALAEALLLSNDIRMYREENNIQGNWWEALVGLGDIPEIPYPVNVDTCTNKPRNSGGGTGTAEDPNALRITPEAPGEEKWILPGKELRISIVFENKAEAVMPARDIRIVLPEQQNGFKLSEVWDLESLAIASTSFVDQNGKPAVVTVPNADGDLIWVFQDIILPPNVIAPEGEGFLNFTVRVRSDLVPGTTFAPVAQIIFDYNEPIRTDVDEEAPKRTISGKPAISGFTVSDDQAAWNYDQKYSGIRQVSLGYKKVGSNDPIKYVLETFEGKSYPTAMSHQIPSGEYELSLHITDMLNQNTVVGTTATINNPVPAFTIQASSGSGGSITPSGNVEVLSGESKSFAIAPSANYAIKSVIVDGENKGALESYTFSNVRANHTIQAEFSYSGGGGGGGSSSNSRNHIITFDMNDGSGSYTNISYSLGQSIVFPTVPVREGFTFKEWNTKADGSGEEFTSASEVNSSIRVYAQWNENVQEDEKDIPLADLSPYSDIDEHWARASIIAANNSGWVKGKTEGWFYPDSPVTRAEFCTMLKLAFGLELPQDMPVITFKDVENHWARNNIEVLASMKIVAGMDENTFGPDAMITREQAISIIIRLCDQLGIPEMVTQEYIEMSFNDSADIADWAREDVRKGIKYKIISGKPGNIFAPKDTTTRAEAVIIIEKTLGLR